MKETWIYIAGFLMGIGLMGLIMGSRPIRRLYRLSGKDAVEHKS